MDGTHTIQCHCQLLSVNWCTYVNQFVSETVTKPPPGIAHKSGLTVVNNPQEPSTPNYVIGYTPSSEQLFSRRTAASHAGYLLPYLKAGMKVLDIGCGPGSISVGLADAVAPGSSTESTWSNRKWNLPLRLPGEGDMTTPVSRKLFRCSPLSHRINPYSRHVGCSRRGFAGAEARRFSGVAGHDR